LNQNLIDLWERIKDGDSRAWSEFVSEYAGLVYAVARRAGLDRPDAEDCAQLTWLALYRSRSGLRDAQALPAWLIRTTRRNAVRTAKSRSSHPTLPASPDGLPPTQLREAELSEFRADLPFALLALDPRCRMLLERLYLKTSSYSELALALGLQTDAIGPLRSRCLKRLRGILEKMGWELH